LGKKRLLIEEKVWVTHTDLINRSVSFNYAPFLRIILRRFLYKNRLSNFFKIIINTNLKIKNMGEILTVAAICFVITLLGLGLGFVFLQVQANT
jgi:hypothetical protein